MSANVHIFSQASTPAVCIGIPVFNGELYLRETLDSVLQQSFADYEIVISDNASTDATATLCKEYAARDPRIRYIRQPQNIGATNNFLRALEQAGGQYFAWLAADDIWKEKSYLADLVHALESGADLAFPDVELIADGDDGRTILQRNVMARFSNCTSRFDYCRISAHLCSHQFYGLFRTSALRASLRFLERATSEGFFVQAVSATLPQKYVPTATAIYRIHTGSVTGTSPPLALFRNHIPYTLKCAAFWVQQRQLSWLERLRILLPLIGINGYYAARLVGAALYRILSGSNGRKRQKRYNASTPRAR